MSLRTRLRRLAARVLGEEPCATCATRIPYVTVSPVDGFVEYVRDGEDVLRAAKLLDRSAKASWGFSRNYYFTVAPQTFEMVVVALFYSMYPGGSIGRNVLLGKELRIDQHMPDNELRLLREPVLVSPNAPAPKAYSVAYAFTGSNSLEEAA